METLKFLVNHVEADIDFKLMRESFRLIDTSNSGVIKIDHVKKALCGFKHDGHVTHIENAFVD